LHWWEERRTNNGRAVRRARKIFTKAGLHMKRAQQLHHEREWKKEEYRGN
jgi:hypothetical protein